MKAVSPFAMDSHTMVKGWSPMIREVLMTRRMPPGQIDGHIGDFINDRLVDNKDVRISLPGLRQVLPRMEIMTHLPI